MTPLTVLTMNTHKGFTSFNRRFILKELREAVRAVSADIVFLQEVLGTHALYAKRLPNWPNQSHYEFVADSIWPNYAYGKNAVYPEGDHGNALLSKFPILKHENLDVSVAGDERRGLLYGVVRPWPDNVEVHLICVHFGLSDKHRNQQLDKLCELIDKTIPQDAPLIVAGDFNDWRGSAHNRLARCAGLKEVFINANGVSAKTFPARWPLLRLDRIYLRNAALDRPITLPRKPWSHLSDHVPLAAEIHI